MTVPARLAGIRQTSIALTALVCLALAGWASHAGDPLAEPIAAGDGVVAAQAKGPLSFIANRGQAPAGTRFYAQGHGYAVAFAPRRATLALERDGRGHVLGLRFVGANSDPVIEARRRAPGKVSYLGGRAGAAQGLPIHREIVYRDLWPGIDMAFRGGAGQLKYTFHVAPGADVSDIRVAYEGATRTSLTAGGDLLVHTPLGALRDPRPRSHQRKGGDNVPVESAFAPAGGTAYGIAVRGHDPRRALVIDPGLVYGTFLGGTGADWAHALAIDGEGNAYVAGRSNSSDFPTTPGAYDPDSRPGMAFVTKLDPTGSELVYSTLIGEGGLGTFAEANGIDVDSEGAAYIAGMTSQSNFPTTAGAFDTTFNGGDSFVALDGWAAKLSPDGTGLQYSTFLGGGSTDESTDVQADEDGHAYVTGDTSSPNFPLTAGAADTNLGFADAFVTKLTPDGSALVYSTFIGGGNNENAEGEIGNIALHDGRAFVTGNTASFDFPTTEGVHNRTRAGCYDVFVTEVNTAGTEFLRSTLAGGASCDYAAGIAVDPEGNPYVGGHTDSADFPVTPGAFDTTSNGGGDAYAMKLDGSTFQLDYSTFIGGSATDNFEAYGDIDVDSRGHAYLTGVTQSQDYPLTPDAVDSSGGIFLTKVTRDGTELDYSTVLGNANGTGVAADEHGNAYIAGTAFSGGVQTTPGAFDRTFNDGSNISSADGFVQKVDTSRDCTVDGKGRLAANKHARLDLHARIRSDDPQPLGRVRYHDADARLLLRTRTITSLIASDGHATLRGSARLRGEDVTFRIELDQRSGADPQHVRIELSNGYSADDELRGRIEIDCA